MKDDETIRYTADVVLLSIGADSQLRVLLICRRWDPCAGMWALPGGHVDRGETAQQAAVRELHEETSIAVTENDLVVVGIYDEPGRDPRGRYVSVGFVTVVNHVDPVAGDDAVLAEWRLVGSDSGRLAFDHQAILDDAVTIVESSRLGTGSTQAVGELSVLEQVNAAAPARSAGLFAAQGEAFACLARWHTARPTSWPSDAELAQYAKAMEIVGDHAYEIIVQTTDAWANRQVVTR